MTMNKMNRIALAFAEQYPGINPFAIYCQFTGKQIGTLMTDECLDIAESLDDDIEAAADDWAMRLFASMRPSLRWNKMRLETIDSLRKSHPVETTAYLLNRLFTPKDFKGNLLEYQHDRIRLFPTLKSLGATESKFIDDLLYLLIDVDAKLGLGAHNPSFTCENFLNKFESIEVLWCMIDAWYQERIKDYDALVKTREMTMRWYRDGNALSKRASVSQFMERQPPSQKAVKAQEKRKASVFMSGLLSEILNESTPETKAAIRPVARKAGGSPLAFLLNRQPKKEG